VPERLGLFSPLSAYRDYALDVGNGHRIFVEECGNPKGQPVVILHGGPGGGCNPTMRRFHDPRHYRIILFDQRGCGRSTPHASLDHNTTQHLVADMEQIRRHANIDHWQVFGGSWGSTLALAYAQHHRDRVTGLVLRGIFLLTRDELLWFYQEGCSRLFPEAFAAYQSVIPVSERGDMIAAHHRRLTGSNRDEQRRAARAWSTWEGTTLSLLPEPDRVGRFAADDYALAFARIEAHYFVNAGFFDHDGALLTNAHKLADIPGVIVHGRYDVVTPVRSALRLHEVWPRADLRIVEDAGHAMTEPGIIDELVQATQSLKSFPSS
jgi:proline iminopeptidase